MSDLREIHLSEILEQGEKVQIKPWSSAMEKRCTIRTLQSLKIKVVAVCVIGFFYIAALFSEFETLITLPLFFVCVAIYLYCIRMKYFPLFYKNKCYIGKKGVISKETIHKNGTHLQLSVDVFFLDGTSLKNFYLGDVEHPKWRIRLSDDPQLNAKRLAYERKKRGSFVGNEIVCIYIPFIRKWIGVY